MKYLKKLKLHKNSILVFLIILGNFSFLIHPFSVDSSPILSQCSELPPQPSHGRWTTVQGVVQDVGHMIRYTCDSGYTLIGPTNRTCLLDGAWLAYNPICVGMNIFKNMSYAFYVDFIILYIL